MTPTTVPQDPNSDTLTGGIRIQAAAQFLPQESDPDGSKYFYVYRVRMVNEGGERVKLHSRHWIILDAENRREDVRGKGVVGRTPELGPGEMFEYRSYCPLSTPWGTMEGSYTFEKLEGSGGTFEVSVGRFFLVPTVDNELVATD